MNAFKFYFILILWLFDWSIFYKSSSVSDAGGGNKCASKWFHPTVFNKKASSNGPVWSPFKDWPFY